MTARRLGGLLGAGLAFLGLVPACEESVTYAYFAIKVSIDNSVDQDFLRSINSCAMLVEGAREDSAELPCIKGQVGYDLGRVEYSTSATTGNLRFVVVMKDLKGKEIARGTSPDTKIKPSATTETAVVVRMVAQPD